MKRVVILLICLILMVGCSEKEKITYKTISGSEAYDMMEAREDIYIVDVRTNEEYRSGHIEEAINVPLDKLESVFMNEVTNDYNYTILVYCQSGRRSEEASKVLSDLGFTNVYNIGGLNDYDYSLVK